MRKNILVITMGIIVACAGVYLFWKSCVLPLHPSATQEEVPFERAKLRGAKAVSGRIEGGAIYLYFSDWDIRFKDGETIQTPEKIFANKPVKLKLSLRQNSASDVAILYVSVALSTNTDVYPGSIGGETWQKSDRQDANEYYYVIRSVVPKGSEVELPYLETSFKTVGVYEVRYTIVLEGYQVIEGCCALNAYESKSGS